MVAIPIHFAKMHGLGNDFVLIDAFEGIGEDLAALSRRLCDRHRGVGGDGLILLLPSTTADVRMRMFNPDGSEAEMCGNGIRCLAAFARQRGRVDKDEFDVETLAGTLHPRLRDGSVTVDMGEPRLDRASIPMRGAIRGRVVNAPLVAADRRWEITCVSMGNPHCVIFWDGDLAEVPLEEWGPAISSHPDFPHQSNVEFVQVRSPQEIAVRVWERGAGATLACGTGACAAMVASHLTSRATDDVTVYLPGGPLQVSWSPGKSVVMTGPYTWVFSGILAE